MEAKVYPFTFAISSSIRSINSCAFMKNESQSYELEEASTCQTFASYLAYPFVAELGAS